MTKGRYQKVGLLLFRRDLYLDVVVLEEFVMKEVKGRTLNYWYIELINSAVERKTLFDQFILGFQVRNE